MEKSQSALSAPAETWESGSVAVYSKEDQNSLHVQLADQRVCIGEGPARNNYLNMERIITAARNVGADAIHPGFGFYPKCRFCPSL